MPFKMQILVRNLTMMIFLFFIVAVFIIQFPRNPLRGAIIERLIIPSRSNTGISFQAPVRGFYIFEYAAGGFLLYNLPEGVPCDRSLFMCYSTVVAAFRGNKIERIGREMDYSVATFSLGGSNVGWTLEEAEETVAGKRVGIGMIAGQQITIVAGDWLDAYDDNTGDITLNVYFVSR